jgi:broad specificity phosphatase PhoE
MKRAFVLAVMLLAGFAGSARAADQVVFLVRHAERAAEVPVPGASAPPAHAMMANDPPLSAAGHARAVKLAAMLASAGVRHVFTTEFLRTRQTAVPLAEKLKLQPVMSASKDPSPLIEEILKSTGNVLVVGHSNTVPDLLKRLGIKETITIADSEYDNLFVVVRRDAGEPMLIRLRY